MKHIEEHLMENIIFCTGMLVLSAGVGFTSKPAPPAGTQVIAARSTTHHVDIDGDLAPAEWAGASVVHVAVRKPYGPPGVVPAFVALPDNQDDSSFTIRAMYDHDNLYIAVTVADDTLMNDGPFAWLDDDVEIFIDGDRQPGDIDAGVFLGQPNNEGFQLITSLGNERVTEPENFPAIVWESRARPAPRGFAVEVRIPLDSINTHDTSPWTGGSPGFRRPEPGDAIGLNVAVGDDDGGVDYEYPNGFLAWDGSRDDWQTFDETAWGVVYLDPKR